MSVERHDPDMPVATTDEFITKFIPDAELADLEEEKQEPTQQELFLKNFFDLKTDNKPVGVNNWALNMATQSRFKFRTDTNQQLEFILPDEYRDKKIVSMQGEIDNSIPEKPVAHDPTNWMVTFEGEDEPVKIFEEVS